MNTLKIAPNGRVAVVGGGISGLSFAFFMNRLRPDVQITLYEKKPRCGGWILTDNTISEDQKIVLEKGPRTLRGVSDGTLIILDILRQLGKSSEIRKISSDSISNRKYILGYDNDLIEVPNSFKSGLQFMTSGLTNGVFRGIISEFFQRKKTTLEDESIEEFMKRRFGSTAITDRILSAVVHGIYAGDVSKMSVKATFPRIVELEKEHGSISKAVISSIFSKPTEYVLPSDMKQYEARISPDANLLGMRQQLKGVPMIRINNGFDTITSLIWEDLSKKRGVEIICNTPVTKIDPEKMEIKTIDGTRKYDHVYSTINPSILSELITDMDLSKLLPLENVSISLVNVYCKKNILIPKKKHGFGFLVPKFLRNSENLLGVIFDSDIESSSTPLDAEVSKEPKENYSKITLMLGGHYLNNKGESSASSNIRAVKNVLSNILKVDVSLYNFKTFTETPKSVELQDNDILVSYSFHKDCIPQYGLDYFSKKESIERLLSSKYNKLSLGGMAYGEGVGVPSCVSSSLSTALKWA